MLKHNLLRSLLVLSCAAGVLCADSAGEGSEIAAKRPIGGYIPLKWPCYFGAGLFGLSAFFHICHWLRSGRPRFMLALLIGMISMTTGFILRLWYIADPFKVMNYAVANAVTILSPCFFLATSYVLLAHLATSLGEDVSARCLLIRRSLLVKIFLGADILTFLIQAGAGGMAASGGNEDMAKYSEWGMLGGLALQVITFALFTVTLIHFGLGVRSHYPTIWRTHKQPSTRVYSLWSVEPIDDWRQLFYVLLVGAVLILIRCVFRTAEYVGGHDSYLATHEGYFYALDATPLWMAMTLFVFLWPTRALTGHTVDHPYTSNMEMGKGLLRQEAHQRH